MPAALAVLPLEEDVVSSALMSTAEVETLRARVRQFGGATPAAKPRPLPSLPATHLTPDHAAALSAQAHRECNIRSSTSLALS